VRELDAWHEAIAAGRLATLRGHRLSPDDLERRWVIGEIMCLGRVRAADWRARFASDFATRFAPELAALAPLAEDGLVELEPDGSVRATVLGRLLLRNVAMAFDAYLPAQRAAERPLFSQTV